MQYLNSQGWHAQAFKSWSVSETYALLLPTPKQILGLASEMMGLGMKVNLRSQPGNKYQILIAITFFQIFFAEYKETHRPTYYSDIKGDLLVQLEPTFPSIPVGWWGEKGCIKIHEM